LNALFPYNKKGFSTNAVSLVS